MDYNKASRMTQEQEDDSNASSRKSSSRERDSKPYKMDKWGSASDSDSFEHKKRRRSPSVEDTNRPNKYQSNSRGNYYNNQNQQHTQHNQHSHSKTKVANLLAEKNSSKIFTPGFDGPLVSLSLFNELQHNILPNEVVEAAYKDYKVKFEGKKYQSFYVEHKDDEWFKEKYDPQVNQRLREERNITCARLAEKFNLVDSLNLQLRPSDAESKNVKILLYTYNSEKAEFEEKEREFPSVLSKSSEHDSIDVCEAPYYGYDPDRLTLFLHQIPRNVSRWTILDVLKKLPGFINMSLSEPIKNQNYCRYCWVNFDNEENCDLAYESLNDYKISNDFKLNTIKSKSGSLKKVRLTPALYEERLEEDLELSKNFVEMYDKERNVVNNPIFERKEMRSKENQLDFQILYLRRVHGFCFYCLEEYEDERALSTKCDNIHLRNGVSLGSRVNKVNTTSTEDEWDTNFSRIAKEKIEKGLTNTQSTNSEELTRRRNEFCKENTTSLNPEKFVCNICSKMFKGPNYVFNHIFNKHMNVISDSVDKEFNDTLKYDNYINDPNKMYEKYKVISSMDDYLYYLNSFKQSGSGQSQGYHNRGNKPSRDFKDRNFNNDRRKPRKDYKDYDNPENNNTSGRKLISYDDL